MITREDLRTNFDNIFLWVELLKQLESMGCSVQPRTSASRLVDNIIVVRKSIRTDGKLIPGVKIAVEGHSLGIRPVFYLLKSEKDVPKVAKKVYDRIQLIKNTLSLKRYKAI